MALCGPCVAVTAAVRKKLRGPTPSESFTTIQAGWLSPLSFNLAIGRCVAARCTQHTVTVTQRRDCVAASSGAK